MLGRDGVNQPHERPGAVCLGEQGLGAHDAARLAAPGEKLVNLRVRKAAEQDELLAFRGRSRVVHGRGPEANEPRERLEKLSL